MLIYIALDSIFVVYFGIFRYNKFITTVLLNF